jgi:hypothetical protein
MVLEGYISQLSTIVTNTWDKLIYKEKRFILAHSFGRVNPKAKVYFGSQFWTCHSFGSFALGLWWPSMVGAHGGRGLFTSWLVAKERDQGSNILFKGMSPVTGRLPTRPHLFFFLFICACNVWVISSPLYSPLPPLPPLPPQPLATRQKLFCPYL